MSEAQSATAAPDLTPPTKEAQEAKKARAPKAPKTPPAEGAAPNGEAKETAARPRKYDYGFVGNATIKVNTPEPIEGITAGMTVEAYLAQGGTNDKHMLRVLSRRGSINIVHPDGNTFPKKLS